MPLAIAAIRSAWSFTPSCPDTIMYASPAGVQQLKDNKSNAARRVVVSVHGLSHHALRRSCTHHLRGCVAVEEGNRNFSVDEG